MTTGTDVIRQAINVRNKKVNLAGFATEVGISPSQLSDFMAGAQCAVGNDIMRDGEVVVAECGVRPGAQSVGLWCQPGTVADDD